MDLSDHFETAARELGNDRVSASYYPYRELKHTWRLSNGVLTFKISDYLEHSPRDVIESMAWYLVCRALRKDCGKERAKRYLEYLHSAELWGRAKELYLGRAKNLVLGPAGKHRDLSVVFRYVNSTYFAGKIRDPALAWVSESPSKRLGFYFAPLRLLAVNRAFDSESVPRYALEFVVYHELLHHIDAIDGQPRRRVHHTKSFKEQERLFSSHADAERWLRRIASGRNRG
jgi:hypothetical protein